MSSVEFVRFVDAEVQFFAAFLFRFNVKSSSLFPLVLGKLDFRISGACAIKLFVDIYGIIYGENWIS